MTEAKPTYTLPIADYRLGPYLSELRCKTCHATLATVVEWDGRTALVLFTKEGYPSLVFRARFLCVCGQQRTFYSMPMSAVRLGIVED